MDSRIDKTRTVATALRATFTLLWQQSDTFVRRRLAVSLLLLFLSSTFYALYPVIYKLAIDSFSRMPDAGALSPAVLIGALVLCNYLLGISFGLRQLCHGLGVQRLNRRINNHLFEHIVHLPLRFHLDRKTGAVGETISQGLNGCQVFLQHAVFTFLPVLIDFLSVFIVLIHFQHSAYLYIFGLSAGLYAYTFWRGAEQIATPSRWVSDAHVEAQATLTDSLLNCETVKDFHAETTICSRYDNKLADKERAWGRVMQLKAWQTIALSSVFMLCMASALSYAGYEVVHGTMTIGDFVLINTYIARLTQPLESIGLAARDLSQALAFLEKMLDLLAVPTESDGSATRRVDRRGAIGVRFEHVTFSYKSDRMTLRDINFDVPGGHTLGIVGASGSGKTSIVRLLLRLYEPDSGRILLDGTPVTEVALTDLRSAIAIVPQDTVLFNDSIANNIAFGKLGASRAEIEAAGRLAHLDRFIASLPEGYDTLVGERGLKLSGGEKQRVAIARAAIKRPLIYIFDEATSSLDSRTEREILQNLIEVSKSSTTIVIAHRLSTVAHADEIVVLDQGSIIEQGSHVQLLRHQGGYAALWSVQNGGVGGSASAAGETERDPVAVVRKPRVR